MKYDERKQLIKTMNERRRQLMDALNPENLNGGKTPANLAEGHYRYYVLQLLADIADVTTQLWGDIADSQGQMAYTYSEMLRLQKERTGRGAGKPVNSGAAPAGETPRTPPSESRYGR